MCYKSCGSRKQVTGNGFRRCACDGIMLYASGAGKLCRMGSGKWEMEMEMHLALPSSRT